MASFFFGGGLLTEAGLPRDQAATRPPLPSFKLPTWSRMIPLPPASPRPLEARMPPPACILLPCARSLRAGRGAPDGCETLPDRCPNLPEIKEGQRGLGVTAAAGAASKCFSSPHEAFPGWFYTPGGAQRAPSPTKPLFLQTLSIPHALSHHLSLQLPILPAL